jgi:hypothetical protein
MSLVEPRRILLRWRREEEKREKSRCFMKQQAHPQYFFLSDDSAMVVRPSSFWQADFSSSADLLRQILFLFVFPALRVKSILRREAKIYFPLVLDASTMCCLPTYKNQNRSRFSISIHIIPLPRPSSRRLARRQSTWLPRPLPQMAPVLVAHAHHAHVIFFYQIVYNKYSI